MKTPSKRILALTVVAIFSAFIGAVGGIHVVSKRMFDERREVAGLHLGMQIAALNSLHAGEVDEAVRVFEYVGNGNAASAKYSYGLGELPGLLRATLRPYGGNQTWSAEALAAYRAYGQNHPKTAPRMR